jgi:hypothetical protein
VVANPTIDVLGALPELELGRVHADYDQAAVGVVAVPWLSCVSLHAGGRPGAFGGGGTGGT